MVKFRRAFPCKTRHICTVVYRYLAGSNMNRSLTGCAHRGGYRAALTAMHHPRHPRSLVEQARQTTGARQTTTGCRTCRSWLPGMISGRRDAIKLCDRSADSQLCAPPENMQAAHSLPTIQPNHARRTPLDMGACGPTVLSGQGGGPTWLLFLLRSAAAPRLLLLQVSYDTCCTTSSGEPQAHPAAIEPPQGARYLPPCVYWPVRSNQEVRIKGVR